ncbi:hypothetical protein OSH11_02470 [Kaistia dalseonensis]|uniref:Uncharacterized protein n=1 Tax=Kaistia dalseonensis TaxID=410840 RepID=A0ABU0H245_9HYPH|nr:hypothetical protein [Kaistia dalseonensis]MDQ0436122.1 hypothetical protein [Kaistia dalseonensis]
MSYLIVQYWDFLSIAAGLGVVVGWWAQGSRRRGAPGAPGAARPTASGEARP